jgi:hypothetical protein
MRIRNACLGLVVLLVPALAHADSHNADAYGGGSGGGGGSNLGGFIVALGKTQLQSPPGQPQRKVLLGGIGGASVQFGAHNGRDVTQVIAEVGPRISFMKPRSKSIVHAQVSAAWVYTNDGRDIENGDEKPNDFGIVVGVAYDYALREGAGKGTSTAHSGLGMRFQADRVLNLGNREDVWRLSAGLIYRVPKL